MSRPYRRPGEQPGDALAGLEALGPGETSRVPVMSALPRTIRLFGELDLRSAREMQSALSEAVGDRTRELIVDLRKVSFIDSTALGALVRAAEQLRNQGRMMTLLITPGDPVDGLIEVSGLSERFALLSEPPETAPGSSSGPAAAA